MNVAPSPTKIGVTTSHQLMVVSPAIFKMVKQDEMNIRKNIIPTSQISRQAHPNHPCILIL